MLSVNKLNQFYGQSHTLWDLSFDVADKACLCVLGRNGVGKTTLMQSIMGLAPLVSGEIVFNGIELEGTPPETRAPSGIAYIPQGRQIFSQLTVEENIKTGCFANRKSSPETWEEIYTLFPVLLEMKNRRGGDLSGGQQQQLAIARALMLNPKLIIMDEPTEGIQPTIVQEIGSIIKKLNETRDITVLIVEQKLAFARLVGTHFIILDRGRLVAQGAMDALSDELVQEYLTV
jgi:urea transport system ATP-binding protein